MYICIYIYYKYIYIRIYTYTALVSLHVFPFICHKMYYKQGDIYLKLVLFSTDNINIINNIKHVSIISIIFHLNFIYNIQWM